VHRSGALSLYTALYAVILNVALAIVLTPLFNVLSARRTPLDETVRRLLRLTFQGPCHAAFGWALGHALPLEQNARPAPVNSCVTNVTGFRQLKHSRNRASPIYLEHSTPLSSVAQDELLALLAGPKKGTPMMGVRRSCVLHGIRQSGVAGRSRPSEGEPL